MLPPRMKQAITDNPKKLANLIDLVNLPTPLRDFMGQSQTSRLGCFMRVWSYIKENKLQVILLSLFLCFSCEQPLWRCFNPGNKEMFLYLVFHFFFRVPAHLYFYSWVSSDFLDFLILPSMWWVLFSQPYSKIFSHSTNYFVWCNQKLTDLCDLEYGNMVLTKMIKCFGLKQKIGSYLMNAKCICKCHKCTIWTVGFCGSL